MQGSVIDWITIDGFVREFESAFLREGVAEITPFLPPKDHPYFTSVLRELIRSDMELRWNTPHRRLEEDYVRLFPEIQKGKAGLEEIRAEQARLQGDFSAEEVRQPTPFRTPVAKIGGADFPQIGQTFVGFQIVSELGRGSFGHVFLAQQGELAKRHVVIKVGPEMVSESQSLAQLQHTNIVPIYSVHAAGAWQVVCMPYLGATTLADLLSMWRGQRLLPGRGSAVASTLRDGIGKTMPTAQPDLPGHGNETESTRQLGKFLTGLSDLDACLWIVEKLAEGLAHAHARGILHRDIKPANILWADHGQPMLLDFSLAADTKLRSGLNGAIMGGTIPYMAPEQLRAFQDPTQQVDHRADLFSTGVVLYELLTGELPFSNAACDLAEMIRQRQRLSKTPRQLNPCITPATEAIIRRCLEPNPLRRYGSALELAEDLRRQRENLPLAFTNNPSWTERTGKWIRRHPRLVSSSSVGLFACVLLILLGGAYWLRHRHAEMLEARQDAARVHEAVSAIVTLVADREASPEQLLEGHVRCQEALTLFQVIQESDWSTRNKFQLLDQHDRIRLRQDVAEILVLWSRVQLICTERKIDLPETPSGECLVRRMVNLADGDLAGIVHKQAAAFRRLETPNAKTPEQTTPEKPAGEISARRRFYELLLGDDHGIRADSLPFLLEAVEKENQNHVVWLTLGRAYAAVGKIPEAVDCYDTALALRPDFFWLWVQRGQLLVQQKAFALAERDFLTARKLRPSLPETYVNLALVRMELGDHPKALEDITHAIDSGISATRVYFIRSKIHDRLGDSEAAQRDFAKGLSLEPNDETSWIARGVARLPNDPAGAVSDFDQALKRNPRNRQALQNKAHVLAEKWHRYGDAIACLDTAIASSPDYPLAYAGRAVLHARNKDRSPAHRDVETALKLLRSPLMLYQAANVYALTSVQHPEDRPTAVRYLQSAIQGDGELLKLVRMDRDLLPLASEPAYQAMVFASQAVYPPPEMAK